MKPDKLVDKIERAKARIRTMVEHLPHFVNKIFLHRNTRCSRFVSSLAQIFTVFGWKYKRVLALYKGSP